MAIAFAGMKSSIRRVNSVLHMIEDEPAPAGALFSVPDQRQMARGGRYVGLHTSAEHVCNRRSSGARRDMATAGHQAGLIERYGN